MRVWPVQGSSNVHVGPGSIRVLDQRQTEQASVYYPSQFPVFSVCYSEFHLFLPPTAGSQTYT